MPAEHIPAAEQDRARLFASVLARYAEEGSPVLLVIDNVSTAAQVTPLIPACGKGARHFPPPAAAAERAAA